MILHCEIDGKEKMRDVHLTRAEFRQLLGETPCDGEGSRVWRMWYICQHPLAVSKIVKFPQTPTVPHPLSQETRSRIQRDWSPDFVFTMIGFLMTNS